MDPRILVEGLFAIASFSAAFWIKGLREDLKAIREDFKTLANTVTNHGERLAVVESQLTDLRKGQPS